MSLTKLWRGIIKLFRARKNLESDMLGTGKSITVFLQCMVDIFARDRKKQENCLVFLLELVEVDPVVEALHLPVLLLAEEDVLEAAGAQDPVTPAVHAEPQLTQQS